jgi:hypothetical protein
MNFFDEKKRQLSQGNEMENAPVSVALGRDPEKRVATGSAKD